jgi:hypothetical protein
MVNTILNFACPDLIRATASTAFSSGMASMSDARQHAEVQRLLVFERRARYRSQHVPLAHDEMASGYGQGSVPAPNSTNPPCGTTAPISTAIACT